MQGARALKGAANPRGTISCEGKLGYRGPVTPNIRPGNWPRLKLDLTADERVVLDPVRTGVYHPYSDAPDGGIEILAYDYIEAFAEKVRALSERTRPRDLYDVVNLFRHTDARPTPERLREVLAQKCEFKGIPMPSFAALSEFEEGLRAAWAHMLEHQLPALPAVDVFLAELPGFFDWLVSAAAPVAVARLDVGEGVEVLRSRRLDLPIDIGTQSYLETIRFAAANRLLVDLDYQGSTRRIEAYSLRRTRAGDILLEAHSVDRNEHRSYRVDRIEGARITNASFVPRYEIELTPEGPMRTPALARASSGFSIAPRQSTFRAARPRTSTARALTSGPVHIFRCPVCGKTFRRKTFDSKLNKHKGKNGYDCFGTFGVFERTEY